MLGFVIYYLLAPVVSAIERTGVSRRIGVTGLFILITVASGFGIYILLPATAGQLSAFKNELPEFIEGTTNLLAISEQKLNSFLSNIYKIDISKSLGDTLIIFFKGLFDKLPDIISSSFVVIILAPFFAFFMLLDGQTVSKKLLALVPNNFFELALNLQHQINVQLGDFIRARLLEAGIVGFCVWLGLANRFSICGYPCRFCGAVQFNVPFGEWEKIPRLQAKTLVSLRYHGELPQDVALAKASLGSRVLCSDYRQCYRLR